MSHAHQKNLSREEFLKTIDQLLNYYLQSNQRFAEGKAQHPNQDAATLRTLATGQSPLMVCICCMDSRVGPETTHDLGLGVALVNRLAGNIMTDEAIGGYEYAVLHGSRLLIVEGHSSCGAATAAVEAILNNQTVEGKLGKIVEGLRPAVEQIAAEVKKEGENLSVQEFVNRVAKRNVELGIQTLVAESPVVAEALKNGQIAIVGTYYDVQTYKCKTTTPTYQRYMEDEQAFVGLLHQNKAMATLPHSAIFNESLASGTPHQEVK